MDLECPPFRELFVEPIMSQLLQRKAEGDVACLQKKASGHSGCSERIVAQDMNVIKS